MYLISCLFLHYFFIPHAWAVAGNGDDCLEGLERLANDGVEYVGMTLLNMPKTLEGRKEYLQAFAESVLPRVK